MLIWGQGESGWPRSQPDTDGSSSRSPGQGQACVSVPEASYCNLQESGLWPLLFSEGNPEPKGFAAEGD